MEKRKLSNAEKQFLKNEAYIKNDNISGVSSEDLMNSLCKDVEISENLKSLQEPIETMAKIVQRMSYAAIQNELTSKRNFKIATTISIFALVFAFISILIGCKPIKIDNTQFNEIISSNKQYSLPNAETHLHASQTIIERKMTHHKNK